MQKLILIDGNSLVHRAFHALPPLSSPTGEIVNAVYGFASIVMNILQQLKPSHMAVIFDAPQKNFRHETFSEYKATRKKAPQELYDQIPTIKEFVGALKLPIFEAPGYEADDAIGTLAVQVRGRGDLEVIIVTGDLDALQLVDEKTSVAAPQKGVKDLELYTPEKVLERFQFRPDQVVDFKALKGDASDNIPGVRGIGEKTACDLLKNYGTLDAIYAHLDDIPEKIRKKLETEKETAYLSQLLASIHTNVPISLDLSLCRVLDFGETEVASFFRKLHFFSLLKRLPEEISPEQQQLF